MKKRAIPRFFEESLPLLGIIRGLAERPNLVGRSEWAGLTSKVQEAKSVSAQRAHPVRGKGRAHLKQYNEGDEPSFSLIRADSRHNNERKFAMETKELPAHPSLEQYKKQAKELLKSAKSGHLEALQH